MHISEGALNAPVLISGAIIALTGIGIGIKRLRVDQIPICGVLAAAFFIASLIHVPIGLSNAHLLLTGLTGIILGWCAFPAIFAGLFLQALLFQYGGLTTLGVNTATMGIAAVCAWYIFNFMGSLNKSAKVFKFAAFLAGAGGIAISSLLTAIALALSSENFYSIALALIVAHIPVMIIEGIISVIVLEFLAKYKPALLNFPTHNQHSVISA